MDPLVSHSHHIDERYISLQLPRGGWQILTLLQVQRYVPKASEREHRDTHRKQQGRLSAPSFFQLIPTQ